MESSPIILQTKAIISDLLMSEAGLKFGTFNGEDKYTTKESERLTRLPMFYGLTLEQVDYISSQVKSFFEG